jgi:hypothetical protein
MEKTPENGQGWIAAQRLQEMAQVRRAQAVRIEECHKRIEIGRRRQRGRRGHVAAQVSGHCKCPSRGWWCRTRVGRHNQFERYVRDTGKKSTNASCWTRVGRQFFFFGAIDRNMNAVPPKNISGFDGGATNFDRGALLRLGTRRVLLRFASNRLYQQSAKVFGTDISGRFVCSVNQPC